MKSARKRFIALRPAPVAAQGDNPNGIVGRPLADCRRSILRIERGTSCRGFRPRLATLRLRPQSASRTLSVDRLPAAKIASLPPHMSPATIEAWGAAAPKPRQVSQGNASFISAFVVRWSLIPEEKRRAGANHRKMAAGGALDSQNRPSPVGQKPTDNPKDCRLRRNVVKAPFFLICKARRKKESCDSVFALTSRLCTQLDKSLFRKELRHEEKSLCQRL